MWSPFLKQNAIQATVFLVAYYIAGVLGQATTNIRSSNIGPVWPAYGVALAAFLVCGYRIWPAIAFGAFVVAFFSPVTPLAALGQAAGATLAGFSGAYLLTRISEFDSSLSRLRDALALVLLGALGSSLVSATIGVSVLYATHVHAYSGLGSAWLIYWLGDTTGVLLVTPIILKLRDFFSIREGPRIREVTVFLFLITGACFLIFGDPSLIPLRLHVLAFAVLPFVMWAAIRFGVAGAALSNLLIATIATSETAFGKGPFATSSPFTNAILLDAFFAVLSVTGLTLASAIAEREQAKHQQGALEARLAAEQVVRTSEERLRLAQQAAHIGTFEWNIQTGVDTWTPELEAMHGLPLGGFGGTQTDWEDLVHPDDLQGVLRLVDEALKTGQPMTGEWRVVWPDKSVHWIAGRWQVSMDESGEPLRVVGVNMDVTERKLAEEARFRHAAIVESSQDAIASGTPDGIIVSWNPGAERMYGYTEAEAVGKPISTLVPPELPDEENKILEALRAGGRIEQFETVRVTKTGKRINVSLSISPIKDSSGAIVGVAGIARDISERKRYEERLREYERAIENAEEMIAVVDREYRYLIANRQFLKMRNMTHQQVVGHFAHEVLKEEVFEDVVKPRLDECFQGKVVRYEMKYRYPEFGERDLLISYFPIEGVTGIDRVACILQDITDRKRAEEALADMSRKLIAAQEQERARIGRELHDDINQRLAMLAVELEQLEDNPEVGSRLRELRKQTTEISNDVQALSHELHSSKLEYLGVVAGIKSWCREFSERQKMEVEFKSAVVSVLPLEVGVCLFRVLQEGLHNAVKYSGTKRVEVQLAEHSNEVHLIVRDSGKGFDIEVARQGRGLGLTSMQERVRSMSGTISIESKPMGGTTIHVRVPVDLGHESQRAAG
jgi:PAS domain S-box-containing protein